MTRMSAELWERVPPEAQAIFLEMAETIRQLQQRVAEQEQRIAELEARLGKTPQNSSLPPATQHPHAKPAPQKPKSKRRRGGQRGHKKHERALIPSDECTQVEILKPTACRRCGGRLTGSDPRPWRHQVWELPEIQPLVTEYQRHRLECRCCGITTCAPLPDGVPAHQSGPRLVALLALLMAYFRQSKRRTSLFCETVLNIPCSPGLVVKLQNQAAAALKPNYEELVAALPDQEILNIDESPTKESHQKAWTWVFAAATFTVFAIRPTRKRNVIEELLTEHFGGIAICDRAKMYWSLPTLQWSWAHLKRDFQALADSRVRVPQQLGAALLEQTRLLFRQWSRCRDGTISWAGLKSSLGPARKQVERLLLRGLNCRHPRTSEVCRELYWYRDRLWTFLEHPGVEPTNNAGERALRHGVIWRKLSFGTQSASGSRFVETTLSVIETCRQQQRNVLTHIAAAVEAQYAHQPPPSLLRGV